jgi:hypothetical protein
MRVNQIDHVEIEVPNRYEAARWYHAALGFDICREYEFWAETASGPLMISTDGARRRSLFLTAALKAPLIQLVFVGSLSAWRA